jgi:hypothetical protein
MTDPSVLQVESSSSAMKASLNCRPTNSGNSSERNLKSKPTQFAPAGAVKSILRIVTSRSLPPAVRGPPARETPESPLVFGSPARLALPVVSIAKLDPSVGKPPSGWFAVPLGPAPAVGTRRNEPVTWRSPARMVWAMVFAPSAVPGTSAIAAYATPVRPASAKATNEAADAVGNRRRRVTRPPISANLAPGSPRP